MSEPTPNPDSNRALRHENERLRKRCRAAEGQVTALEEQVEGLVKVNATLHEKLVELAHLGVVMPEAADAELVTPTTIQRDELRQQLQWQRARTEALTAENARLKATVATLEARLSSLVDVMEATSQ